MAPPAEKRSGAASTAPDLKTKVTSSTKNSARRYQSQAKWKAENPAAVFAHQCVRGAVKRGLLVPQPCAECGDEPAEAHHANGYFNVLDVVWLCRRHHKAAHRKAPPDGA